MTSISCSIIVLSGAIVLAVGSLVPHNDTQLFLQLAGGGVAIIGLWAWFNSIRKPGD